LINLTAVDWSNFSQSVNHCFIMHPKIDWRAG